MLLPQILIAALVLFSLRRMLWVMASWLPSRKGEQPGYMPFVQVTSAFRNEEDSLPALLQHLDALDYDPAKLSICLVDDGSADHSAALADAWAQGKNHVRLLSLAQNCGKAAALNHAIHAAAADVEAIVVYDADQRPHPDCLRRLVAPLSDPRVDAAGGYCRPVGPANVISAYACLEAWTHQLVNLAAKDVLNLNPPTMGGNCAYRRTALNAIGGFPVGSFSEDIAVSLAMNARGGRTRFIADAITEGEAVRTFHHFYNQRQRWNRGMMEARRHARGLEAAFVTAGYLDRVLLVLAVVAIGFGVVNPWWLIAYILPALAAVLTAVAKAHPAPGLAAVVLMTFPCMFVADLAVSVLAVLSAAGGRSLTWNPRPSSGTLPS